MKENKKRTLTPPRQGPVNCKYVTNNQTSSKRNHHKIDVPSLMPCSLFIIAPLCPFVKMQKYTIFSAKVCKKSGKCKKIKKVEKTIDKWIP